ncbi:MCE family protein [Mycolicibacterium sp. CH28]|uniref:MCE family protein n=1 Tax=Mycolicibacterium sp. CH28 TaxID=2512237 RepID=UPI001F30EA44|nr:MCE family protein [Mycolicibacterium sp. CH28]
MSQSSRRGRSIAVMFIVGVLICGAFVAFDLTRAANKTRITAYFANSNGIFVGDEVSIAGVAVGRIDSIEPEPLRAKITLSVDGQYKIPADTKAVIMSPALVTSRAIQLTPAYRGGPVLQDGAVIPESRTAVPVEFDDLRRQLERLTDTLQPTAPGGVSTLGSFINTAAGNLRGQGADIHDTIVKLSQAFSALGDHSKDIFSTVKNLSILVSALQSSTDLMRELNRNLAATTGLLTDDHNEVGNAVSSIDSAVGDVQSFISENRETIGTTSDKLASVTTALTDSLDDIKQTLHVAPGTLQNYVNIYQPAQGTLSGALAINNFANPISFLCGAIQAASRLSAEQSAKLCVQYLAPIIKNRQYNFPPLGQNLFVGASARPNEVTYSEDWMRPDYVPPAPVPAAAPSDAPASPSSGAASPPLPAEAQPTSPEQGLRGMMAPPGGGS